MAESGSSVEQDQLSLADDLIAAFEKVRTRSHITGRAKVAPLRLAMAYGLAAQAHDIGITGVAAGLVPCHVAAATCGRTASSHSRNSAGRQRRCPALGSISTPVIPIDRPGSWST